MRENARQRIPTHGSVEGSDSLERHDEALIVVGLDGVKTEGVAVEADESLRDGAAHVRSCEDLVSPELDATTR